LYPNPQLLQLLRIHLARCAHHQVLGLAVFGERNHLPNIINTQQNHDQPLNPRRKTKKYDVVGNICESGDCFAVDRRISEIGAGDILDIQNAGAYCYSMGGFYNLRPMPAEVMVMGDKEKVITPRPSYQQFIDRICGGG